MNKGSSNTLNIPRSQDGLEGRLIAYLRNFTGQRYANILPHDQPCARLMSKILHEEWKPVVGYEGYYEISSTGRVKSLSREVPHAVYGTMRVEEKILKQSKDDKGYPVVTLYSKYRSKKTIQVHKIVATAFIGERRSCEVVRHGEKGKQVNSVDNICYGTHKQNMKDKLRDGTQPRGQSAPGAKLSNTNIIEIKQLYAEGVYQKDIAKKFKISQSLVSRIVNEQRRQYG